MVEPGDRQNASSPATRIFHSYPGATYALPADEEERSRLTDQHELLKHTFDGKILLAPITLRDGDVVLDSCTGIGIWLLELAQQITEGVQLEDSISKHAFSLQQNHDLKIPLPSERVDNRFSLVHQRLAVLGLQKEEWPVALKELHRVTKPGGWVELWKWGGEKGILQQSCHTRVYEALKPKVFEMAKDTVKTDEFERLMEEMVKEYDSLKCTHEWVRRSTLQAAGRALGDLPNDRVANSAKDNDTAGKRATLSDNDPVWVVVNWSAEKVAQSPAVASDAIFRKLRLNSASKGRVVKNTHSSKQLSNGEGCAGGWAERSVRRLRSVLQRLGVDIPVRYLSESFSE
ncbi:hypothetical protein BDQ17DRAFT_1405317 [Cyathus striatus]|nr:hypothetical protein BDQ17DRAFT_1405317 [Cyathus striatus]